ncbi:MAG: hypothetical protein EZS28_005458 [Streblomastix strix]|uniref:Uncharacterized protein n=1 Tax=Streblomastix strix TaxID=222440 RepID=A0A5J4WVD8_9EUKA|nr:MAG: hypothetical protein EZS28_005458 [Streblomastix strix]
MKASNSEQEPSTIHINLINEPTIDSEELTTTYCVSILAVLGMLHIVVDRAREAKREGREYGGSFMIFGEAEIEHEDNEVALRKKSKLIKGIN